MIEQERTAAGSLGGGGGTLPARSGLLEKSPSSQDARREVRRTGKGTAEKVSCASSWQASRFSVVFAGLCVYVWGTI